MGDGRQYTSLCVIGSTWSPSAFPPAVVGPNSRAPQRHRAPVTAPMQALRAEGAVGRSSGAGGAPTGPAAGPGAKRAAIVQIFSNGSPARSATTVTSCSASTGFDT